MGSPSMTFTAQPTNTVAGQVINSGSGVIVRVLDGSSNPIENFPVGIAIEGDGFPSGDYEKITGADGYATFDDLSINTAGNGYVFSAGGTSGPIVLTALSDPFNITAGSASKLGFVQQPTNTRINDIISPDVTVQVQDSEGNAVAGAGVDILITPSDSSITGTTTQATAAGGLSTFDDLVGSRRLLHANLVASSTGLTSATSDWFRIGRTNQGIYYNNGKLRSMGLLKRRAEDI